jgi:dUTP pyrophosphatase
MTETTPIYHTNKAAAPVEDGRNGNNLFRVQLCIERDISGNPERFVPQRATPDSAGMDVRADIRDSVVLSPGERGLVSLGFKAAFPPGYVALMFIRSGHALKSGLGLANGVAVIDSDYRGQWRAILVNNDPDRDVAINPGERIGQIVLLPCAMLGVAMAPDLDPTARGGGFGSTGER